MELGTFGAILRSALDRESQAAAFYRAGARGDLEVPFRQLAEGSEKRAKELERARREGVAEMILESISGLEADSYVVLLDPAADREKRIEQGARLEETAARFYRDAAAKIPIREIVRLFERLAKDSDLRRERLGG